MKAVISTKYGPPEVLKVEEVPTPVPKTDEVMIRVHTSTVTMGDCELRRFDIPFPFWLPLRLIMGLRRPVRRKIPGSEFAGIVESAGANVTQYQPGDAVFGPTLFRFGAYAEYVCLPETYPIIKKPDGIAFEEVATLPTGGINGLHFVRKSGIREGEQLLINGAGGSIGTYGLQIARDMGVIVSCVDSGEKRDMLRSLGAAHVFDYENEDFTQQGNQYHAIIDVVGNLTFRECLPALKPGGRLVMGNPGIGKMLGGWITSMGTDKKVIPALAGERIEDFNYLLDLLQTKKIKAVIDRNFPLEEMVEVHRYVEGGNKKGNVVILVEDAE